MSSGVFIIMVRDEATGELKRAIKNLNSLRRWPRVPRPAHVPKHGRWYERPWECLSRRERRRKARLTGS